MRTRTSRPSRRAAFWLPLILFAASLTLYLSTLAPGLVRGDGGELQYRLATLGVPHPTGYPLYALAGWLWTKILPVGSVAWRINLISALCGAGAVTLVYAIVHRLVGRVLPALAGAVFLAASPTFWILSSITEVYALHAFFVALVLYLLLVWRDAGPHRPRWLLLISFVYGLSLSHHRTIILLAPAMLLFVLLETWRSHPGMRLRIGRRSVGSLFLLAVAFLAGLLPYVHVFIQQFHRGRTLRHAIYNVILGGDFAGFLGLRPDVARVAWELPRHEIGLMGLALALAGLAWLAWRRDRAAWLLGGALVTNLAFCLVYRVPDIEDFALPTTLLLCILAGTAGGWLSRRQHPTPAERPARRKVVRLALEVALLGVALLSFRHLGEVRAGVAARDGGIEDRARELLAYPFEPGAAVIVDWELATAVVFLRDVEDAPREPRVIPARLGDAEACATLKRDLDAGVPYYFVPQVLITRLPDGLVLSEAAPYLKLVRQASVYTPLDRPLDSRLTLLGIGREGNLLVLRWQVTGTPLPEDYATYVHYFDAAGQPLGQTDKAMGAEQSCWYPPTTWPTGQIIQDVYPLPAGTTTVRVGYYAYRDGQIEPQGSDVTLPLP